VRGNLRWRLLGADAAGQLVPRPDLGVGRVKVLDPNGQVNFEIEGPTADGSGGTIIVFADFAAHQALGRRQRS
jgi:hypothetical protein